MRRFDPSGPGVTRRQLLLTVGAVAAGLAAVPLYAVGVEPDWVELVRRPMPMPGLPEAWVGRTVLQVSDLHVGPRVSTRHLVETLRGLAPLAPDLVVVTGDFVTWRGTAQLAEVAEVLAALPRGRLGTFASLGNHDYGHDWRELGVADAITRVATDAGIRVLRNARTEVEGLQVAGLGDLWSPEFHASPMPDEAEPATTPLDRSRGAAAVLAGLDPARPALVLCHNPDGCDAPIWEGVRGWVLAGHTHGGQVKPPFLQPPVLPIRNARYASGEVPLAPGRTLYVNRGLGHLIRLRLNARPEATLFTLARA